MRRAFFESLRFFLVALTGRGYDRPGWLNNLHHKLAHRLHKLLPAFGITGIQRVRVPGLPGRFMDVRAEDGGVAHQLIMYRQYEPFESRLVREHLKPGMAVYNIGANLGYYALVASECVGAEGTVYAFEPEPNNLELLGRTISENDCANIEIHSVAVAAESGVAMLSISATNSGDHQLTSIAGRTSVQVPTLSLDDFIAEGPPPDAIIMDVQGSELDVLRGARNLIGSNRSLLLFTEFWPAGLNARHPNGAVEMLAILESAGFQLYSIDERRRLLTPINSRWAMQNVRDHSEINIFAIRS